MADTHRHKIMKAVNTLMKTILITNGYVTNIGSKVKDWKTTPWASDELPGLTARDIDEEVELQPSKTHEMLLRVSIEAIYSNTTSSIESGRAMLGDIVTALGTSKTWIVSGAPLAMSTYLRSSRLGVDQEEKTFSAVEVNIEIKYRLNQFDPYTNPGQ